MWKKLVRDVQNTIENLHEAEDYLSEHADEISTEETQTILAKMKDGEKAWKENGMKLGTKPAIKKNKSDNPRNPGRGSCWERHPLLV